MDEKRVIGEPGLICLWTNSRKKVEFGVVWSLGEKLRVIDGESIMIFWK